MEADPLPSAAALVAQFRSGARSPVDVVRETLAAIESNAGLNAFWTTDADTGTDAALAAAARAEAAWRAGEVAAGQTLLGVPVAVKDLFDTAGVRTTYGSSFFRDHVPVADADAVVALRKAGAIVVGKTATHEFAYGVTTVNPHYGPARNPHDPTRVTGGSSGGSAAAVAAGIVPIALGSDTSCSSRLPPAWCGCVGFRPTHDTISLAGAMPLAPSLDTVGPIGASVADVALLSDALWRGSPGLVASPRPTAALAGRAMRVGVVDDWAVTLEPAVARALRLAADALADLGCVVGPADIAGYTSANDVFGPVMLPEAVHTHRRLGFWPDRGDGYGADVAARLRLAEAVTFEQYLDAQLGRRALRATMTRAFERLDVVLTPSAAITAPAIDDCDEPVHDGRHTPIRELTLPFHVVEALCGCPAVCLPAGVDERGLPTSVMLSAAPGHDLALLEVAARLEAALGYGTTRASTRSSTSKEAT